jgi:hypothetical protein
LVDYTVRSRLIDAFAYFAQATREAGVGAIVITTRLLVTNQRGDLKRAGVLGRPSASVQRMLDLNRGRIACHGLAGRGKPMAQLGSNVSAIGSNSL